MKTFILFCFVSIMIQAEEMSIAAHQSLHIYNRKPSVQVQLKQKMHALHKIDEVEAKKIAQSHCADENIQMKLVHKKAYLLYDVYSKTCSFYINALDGKIIDKESFWGGK